MSTKRFTKAPLSAEDKEKKAEEFVSMMPTIKQQDIQKQQQVKHTTYKDSTVNYALRLPKRIYSDLRDLSNLTGLSINSICIEILRVSVKEKLKEFNE